MILDFRDNDYVDVDVDVDVCVGHCGRVSERRRSGVERTLPGFPHVGPPSGGVGCGLP